MIFFATIQATTEEVVTCRIFSPALGAWWDGAAWGSEGNAALTVIPSVGSSRHSGPVVYPDNGVVVEYLIDGVLEGEDAIPIPPPTVTMTEEETASLAAVIAAGVGENLPSPVVIPLMTGGPTTVSLTKEKRINLKRGDTYRLTFSLGRDCTGWDPYFGGKLDTRVAADDYQMPVRQAVFVDVAAGTGYVDLTKDDTAVVGTVFAELELRRGDQTNTPESYTFKIGNDIVK